MDFSLHKQFLGIKNKKIILNPQILIQALGVVLENFGSMRRMKSIG
jgi:hypothetical protein